MIRARIMALCAFLLGACYALAQPLAPDVTPSFQSTEQNPSESLANTTLLLLDSSPQFTFWAAANSSCSAATSGGSGVACRPQHWLAVALTNVYEVDKSGKTVPERSGAAVLDASAAEWVAQDAQLGQPEVPGYQATMRLPFQQPLPPCPGSARGSANAAPAPGGVTLVVQLFGGLTNVSFLNSSLEILPGNVKWSIAVDKWPFCDPSHSLVLAMGLLPAGANGSAAAGKEVSVEQGSEVQARWEEQEALLTGAADPDSVPVSDGTSGNSSTAPLPDPAAAGRRLLARRGGGFKIGSSKPATRPTSPVPTGSSSSSGSGSGPATRPDSPSPTGGFSTKPYRPYFPGGGTSRPRYRTPAAAVSSLPFAAAQRPYLASRFNYGRPVYGFGRRPLLPYSTFLFFPVLYGAGLYGGYGYGRQYPYAPAVDVQGAVLLNNSTVVRASVEVPAKEANGVQPVLVTVPYFQGSALYDPVAAIGESDLAVVEGIEAALNETMAYGDTGGNSSAAAPHGGSGLIAVVVSVAAAAGLLLV